ncbi:DDB1- and CUL4-associated factor 13 [Trichonephila clavipes]|nr:DDB1- and CUL4-associated factor 13 [Trichonephila clavipes]
MKVKMLSRNPLDYLRETKNDIHKIQRNYDPALHPFEVAREYTRALNAVKLERVFAKPLLHSLDGHLDGIQCMLKHPTSLSVLFSGAYDGEIRMWDLATQKCLHSVKAHDGIVRGMCMPWNGDCLLSIPHLLLLMPPDQQCQIKVHEVHPEYPGGGQGPYTYHPLPPTLQEDLRLDGYIKYPHAAKALHIYTNPCLPWDLNPGPMTQQSMSLTTISDGQQIPHLMKLIINSIC